MLRSAKVTDAPLIADIYNYYVDKIGRAHV